MSQPRSPEPVNEQPEQPRKKRTRRRWFQFGLGTLLVLVTLCGVLLAAWRAYLAPYRAQRETMALIERLKGSYQTQEAASWANRLSLTPAHNVVLVNLADCDQPAEYVDAVSRLPRLETLVVGGLAFGDEHLARLQKLTALRWLVLDSTSVTVGGVEAVQRPLPHLYVHHSERRAIAAVRGLKGNFDTKPSKTPPALIQLIGWEFREFATMVNLSNAKVTDDGLAHLAGLKNLEWLNIHSAKVTDAGLAHFSGLKNLKRLDLDNTMVTDAGLAHLAGLRNLNWLLLNNTKVTDTGLATLRRALPKCEIWPKASDADR